jgi:N-acetylglucosaminyl-diphospho-decaprenol L-rhamnosyltransferase
VTLPKISAVIANYEGEQVLPDCLESLANQRLAPSEVLVVDAGSADRSVETARARGARVIETENRGVGHLYNVGARAARSPLLLLANNDVAFDRDCLELLAAELDTYPNRFAADPCQRDWDGGRVIHARSTIRYGPLLRVPLPGHRIDQNVAEAHVSPTLLANGAAMLVRRESLLALGGFDESFFMEFEELDVCWRAWLRGWETVYVPRAGVRHRVGHATTQQGVRVKRVRSAHHNLLRFALKCFPGAGIGRVLVGELARLPAHPLVIGPALVRVAVELPEILKERRRARPSAEVYHWLLDGQR